MFWPMIERVAQQQIGKPNHSKLIKQLQQQDPHFEHLSHQRIGEWREEKCQKCREQNRISQQKHRKKVKGQEQKAGLQDESKIKLPVSEMFTMKAFNS